MKKSLLFFYLILVLGASLVCAQSADNPALKPILNNFGARNYSSEQVSRAHLDLIVQAGIRAPSAGNKQPWHFTVVQNQTLVKQLVPQATDGNALIIISAAADNKTDAAVVLDCALAAQSMYLAAQALGLGSRIYTGPVENINNRFKADLGLAAGNNAIIVIRIGRLPADVDAVSSASQRNSREQLVSYK